MNVAQLGGPWLGGVLLEVDGFYLPFLVMGSLQVVIYIFFDCIIFQEMFFFFEERGGCFSFKSLD